MNQQHATVVTARPDTAVQPHHPGAQNPPPPHKPSSGGSGLTIALLIIVVLIIGLPIGIAFLMWNKAAIDAPTKITGEVHQLIGEALRPKININNIVFTSIEDMHRQQKLVVLQTTVDADVTREEGDTSWGMYWGTNVARVAVKGARVQYYIDLAGLGTGDFLYSDSAKTLTVSVPKPRLDTQMVSIDPARIQTLDLRGGWARWDKQRTRQDAIDELRPQIITQANSPFMQKQAQEAGRDALKSFLAPLVTNLKDEGVKVIIAYQDAAGAPSK